MILVDVLLSQEISCWCIKIHCRYSGVEVWATFTIFYLDFTCHTSETRIIIHVTVMQSTCTSKIPANLSIRKEETEEEEHGK